MTNNIRMDTNEREPVVYRTVTGKGLNIKEYYDYISWRSSYKFFDKKFSILGDSISTLEKYNPKGYRVYYSGDRCRAADVFNAKDTWWGKVICFLGGKLLENNSYSGSLVTKLPDSSTTFPSACGNERTSMLHLRETKPDVIIVNMGTNDWLNNIGVYPEDEQISSELYFAPAYDHMILRLRRNYPDAEIYCCTLCGTYISSNKLFYFQDNPLSNIMTEYNEVIKNVAFNRDCKIIDLSSILYDTIDGVHPNIDGMTSIASAVIRSMVDNAGIEFLECYEDKHKYKEISKTEEKSEVICVKCGRLDKISTKLPKLKIPPKPNKEKHQEENTVVTNEVEQLEEITSLVNYIEQVENEKTTLPEENNQPDKTVSVIDKCDRQEKVTSLSDDGKQFEDKEIISLEEDNQSEETESPINESEKRGELTEEARLSEIKSNIIMYVNSGFSENSYFEKIIEHLKNVPLTFPVEVNANVNVNLAAIPSSEIIINGDNAQVKFFTIKSSDNRDFVPTFTSDFEGNKGPNAYMVKLKPEDYIPAIIDMNKDIVINPFGCPLIISRDILKNRILFDLNL